MTVSLAQEQLKGQGKIDRPYEMPSLGNARKLEQNAILHSHYGIIKAQPNVCLYFNCSITCKKHWINL